VSGDRRFAGKVSVLFDGRRCRAQFSTGEGLMKRALTTSLLLALTAMPSPATPAPQPSVLGRWLSESGNGVVDLYPCAGKVCGKLVWLQRPVEDGKPAIDNQNPDPNLQHRPLCGMQMLGDFRQIGDNRWGDGWVYNPEDGRTYGGSMALEGGEILKLRGYVLISLLGKTETWTRPDPTFRSCDQ
jgi:uncharacterized protein (DUF2147 family)